VFNITADDVNNKKLELVFFDCHNYEAQMKALEILIKLELINDNTVIAIHDTNTHPLKYTKNSYQTSQGFVHQKVERKMVNDLVDMGYHAICLHTTPDKHSDQFPFRHGITILTKFIKLEV
jgi:hypothetical protein